jgi:hypothetical protein
MTHWYRESKRIKLMEHLGRVLISKSEFGRQLQQAGRHGLYHLAKERVGIVAIDSRRPKELGVIENVESLDAKLQRPGVVDARSFLHYKVSIEIPRAGKRPPPSVAERTQRVCTEQGGVEIRLSIRRVMVDVQGSGYTVRQVDVAVIHPVWIAAHERIVEVSRECHGQTGAGLSHS